MHRFRGLPIFVLVTLMAGCGDDKSSPTRVEMPITQVRVQEITERPHLATEQVVGTVRPKLSALLEAKISSRIEQMLAAPGKMVTSGELLVELDAREIKARLDQAIASRDQLGRDTERLRSLLTKNAVSVQDFETGQARYRVAAASVVEGETLLAYTRVTAPFNGVVTRKFADVGDLAAPGKRLLELEDPSALRIEADVPESLIHRVQLGEKLQVATEASSDVIDAVVSEIAPAADMASRTFLVKLDLPTQTTLRSGQFARVKVPSGETHTLRIPESALVQRGQLEFVFVELNRVASLRLVKTGKRIGREVELVSGVEAGERVVVEGGKQLRDGQPLEIRP